MSIIIVNSGTCFVEDISNYYYLATHPDDRIVCIDKLTFARKLSTLKPVMDNPNFRFL